MQKKSNTQKILSIWMKAGFENLTKPSPPEPNVEVLSSASKSSLPDTDRPERNVPKNADT